MNNLTQEQREDVQTRIESFSKKMEEMELAIVSFPQFIQDADGMFKVNNVVKIVDTKYAPKPSPFVDEIK